jgi:Na+/melibiose symporter-like transporter
VSDTAKGAVEDRLKGKKSGRMRAFIAAVVIAFMVAVTAYRLLRSGNERPNP